MKAPESLSELAVPVLVGSSVLYGVYKLQNIARALLQKRRITERRKGRLVAITGCDSGLGLTMAKWALDAGYTVLAGCLNDTGAGPQLLMSSNNNDGLSNGGCVFVQQLDVTKKESIEAFLNRCLSLLTEFNLELYALIPNAAVAVPGEFFWLTEDQVKHVMDVNFWGVTNLTDAFQRPLLEHRSRLIVVSSDCADFPLPVLATYCASKAAVESWAIAFRLEVAKFGITVVAFQPGSFVLKSRLMCLEERNTELMQGKISQNDTKQYHEKYMDLFLKHYKFFNQNAEPGTLITDSGVKRSFFTVLESDMSKTCVYVHESWSQSIFHLLLKRLPRSMSDGLIRKLVMPKGY